MAMAIEYAESEGMSGFPPYPASDVDRLLAWVDGLRLTAWLFYLLLLAALILFFNGLAWIDGSPPFPAIDVYRSSVVIYPVASLALEAGDIDDLHLRVSTAVYCRIDLHACRPIWVSRARVRTHPL
jgi:hypothetical protein